VKKWNSEQFNGVWSATPTPFDKNLNIDIPSIKRMVEHHLRLGVKGLFLCGTCGEGPWLTDSQRKKMIQETVRAVRGRIPVAVQVTDNSSPRIIENMKMAAEAGADIAVIAPPYFLFNATPHNILSLYRQAIRRSPLPVGIYDRGRFGTVLVPDNILGAIYAEPKVILIKDSSTDENRMKIAIKARAKRPKLKLLNGNEFNCVAYIKAGYDGLLLGGGIFNGYIANMIIKAVQGGDTQKAEQLQKRMNKMMWAVYGGKKIKAWLTGLKELLVRMGIFNTNRNYLNYPLSSVTSKAIDKILKKEKDILLPKFYGNTSLPY